MKKLECFLGFIALLIFFGNVTSQEIIRTSFLQIGDAPFRQNITKNVGNGFSMYTVSSEYFDEEVKSEIKTQNNKGFKTVDNANFLFGPMRTLDSQYPVEAGMTYRIIAISETQKEAFIFRAVNEDGVLVVPEIEIPGDYRKGLLHAQLEDYVPSHNGTIRIQNLTMSKDVNEYSAVRYLIFKKKK